MKNKPDLMKDWFRLVQEKNALVRWQEELTIKAKELELEDRHGRLENELRQRMNCSGLNDAIVMMKNPSFMFIFLQ